jgi:enolase
MTAIVDIIGREILDSRGNPTVEVDVLLEDGARGRAGVPSGASTGAHEAVELRDGDKARYQGKGVLKAVDGRQRRDLRCAVGHGCRRISGASTRCCARSMGRPTRAHRRQRHPRRVAGGGEGWRRGHARAAALSANIGGPAPTCCPVPMMNIINGGAHADNPIDIQEFMIMPVGAPTCADAIRVGSRCFHTLRKGLKDAGHSTKVGDEGGFAPNLKSAEEAIGFIMKAIEKAGYKPGDDVVLALDCAATISSRAASTRWQARASRWKRRHGQISGRLVVALSDRVDRGRHVEDDWAGLEGADRGGGRQVPAGRRRPVRHQHERLAKGIKEGIANSILVKVNQIGSLSETLDAVSMAQRAAYTAVISHRSGETEDATIADIAVATNAGQIKTGSLSRSDRMAKYNQLIRIEEELGEPR